MQTKRVLRVAGALVMLATLVANVAPATSAAGPTATGSQEPIDLNDASVEQLTAIPGIGDVTAARIVAWREAHGPFRRVEDLMKVKGIGERSFEKLRAHVKVGKGR